MSKVRLQIDNHLSVGWGPSGLAVSSSFDGEAVQGRDLPEGLRVNNVAATERVSSDTTRQGTGICNTYLATGRIMPVYSLILWLDIYALLRLKYPLTCSVDVDIG